MDNSAKLLRLLSGVFRQPVDRLTDDSGPDNVPGWDSLAMVNLVPELEDAFGVRFDILEIADFKSVALIKTILADKGVPFP